jgi:hypothetical protein
MSNKRSLPTVYIEQNLVARQLEGTLEALATQGPISGFLHRLRNSVSARSLDADTGRADALRRNLAAHGGVVREMLNLRDTVDEYEVRQQLAGERYDMHLRRGREAIVQQEMRWRKETADLEWDALEAEARRDAKRQFAPRQMKLGHVRMDARLADAEITSSIHQTTLDMHRAETNGSMAAGGDATLKALEDIIKTQCDKRQEAAADGKDTSDLDRSIAMAVAAKEAYLATI